MARLSGTVEQLMGQGAFNTRGIPMSNANVGGTFGYAPTPAEYLGTQGYKPNHLVVLVLETPRIYEYLDKSELWVASWRLLWEKHARVIEGWKATLNIETADHPYAGGGEKFDEYIDVKREASALSMQFHDLYGNLYQTFLEKTAMYAQMDPVTKIPLAATLGNVPTDLLADMYGGTVIAIEPDPVGRKCVRAWLSTNVWHKTTGPIEGKTDKTSALALKDLTIDWTSLSFYGDGVSQLGQEMLDGISWAGADNNKRAGFVKSVAPDVAAIAQGWKESVSTTAAQSVTK